MMKEVIAHPCLCMRVSKPTYLTFGLVLLTHFESEVSAQLVKFIALGQDIEHIKGLLVPLETKKRALVEDIMSMCKNKPMQNSSDKETMTTDTVIKPIPMDDGSDTDSIAHSIEADYQNTWEEMPELPPRNIHVKVPTKDAFSLKLHADDTLCDMKAIIRHHTSQRNFTILYRGTQLDTVKKLKDGDVVNVVFSLGGPPICNKQSLMRL